MSDKVKNRLKTMVAEGGSIIVIMVWVPLILLSVSTQGYAEEGIKQPQDIPSKSIVLFEIEGDDGKQFTKMLGTELSKLGRRIIYGDQFGESSDLMAAAKAKIARDTEADVFIVGQITKSEVVDYSKYTISGTFMLHEVENGDQIGGIADMHYTENLDAIGKAMVDMSDFIAGILGGKHRESAAKKREELVKKTISMSPKVKRVLAEKVAKELSKELGAVP